MKKYFLLSFCIHLAVIVAYFSSKESEQTNDTSSLETVTFDLGLLAAPVQSIEVKKTASKAQQQKIVGANQSIQTKSNTTTPSEKSPEKQEPAQSQNDKVIDTKADMNTKKVNTGSSRTLVSKAQTASKQESIPEKNEPKTTHRDEIKDNIQNIENFLKQKSSSSASNILGAREKSQASVEHSSTKIEQATGGKATQSKKQNTNSVSYTAELQRRISQQAARTYPRKAKRERQQGVVKVAFIIDSSGNIGDIKVVTSSDSLLLDKSAIKAVQRVGRYKPLPEGMNPDFEIPIRFSLL